MAQGGGGEWQQQGLERFGQSGDRAGDLADAALGTARGAGTGADHCPDRLRPGQHQTGRLNEGDQIAMGDTVMQFTELGAFKGDAVNEIKAATRNDATIIQ